MLLLFLFGAFTFGGNTVLVDGKPLTGITVTGEEGCKAFIKQHVGKYSVQSANGENYVEYKENGTYYDAEQSAC